MRNDRAFVPQKYPKKLRGIPWNQIKWSVIGLMVAVLSIALQTTVLSHVTIPFLGKAAPSLTLLWVVAAGFFLGERQGAVMGVLSGFLLDAAMGETFMMMPILYTLCGYVVGILSKERLAHNFPSFMVWGMICGVWEQVTLYIRGILTVGGFPPSDLLINELLPRQLLTLLFACILYPMAKCMKKIFVCK